MNRILLVSLVVLGGCQTAPKPITAVAGVSHSAPVAGTVAVEVRGLGCPLCATNVKKSLERVPGVNSAQVDLGNGTVALAVRDPQKPTDDDLKQAVVAAGFTPVKVIR